jgi:hypothetical protein
MPVPVAVSPAHLFGPEVFNLSLRCHGRADILIAAGQPPICRERRHHQRRGLRGRGQRGCSGKSDGEFQKVAAFHDISLFVFSRVMRGEFERVDMNDR